MSAHLPQDILRTVLSDWLELDVKTISLLDRSFCSHALRAEFLPIISHLTIQEDVMVVIKRITNYLEWLINRRPRVTQLWINPNFLPRRALTPFELGPHGRHSGNLPPSLRLLGIKKVSFVDKSYTDNNNKYGIVRFLSQFPSLLMVDFHDWYRVDYTHISQLTALKVPLIGLDIRHCSNVLYVLLDVVACHPELQELNFRVETKSEQQILLFTQRCASLKRITLNCTPNNFNSLKGLLIKTAHQLEALKLSCYTRGIKPEDVVEVSINDSWMDKFVPPLMNLKYFALGRGLTMSSSRIQHFLSCCPKLELIELFSRLSSHHRLSLVITTLADGSKVHDICCHGVVEYSDIEGICLLPSMSIRTFTIDESSTRINTLMLTKLAGEQLQTLRCVSTGLISTAALKEFCERSLNLTDLAIKGSPHMPSLRDTDVALIARCAGITSLNLSGNQLLTDDSVILLVKTLKLKNLTLKNCTLLTDKTLANIANGTRKYSSLNCVNTAMTKETMLYVVAGNFLRADKIFCCDAVWVLTLLKQIGHSPLPTMF